MKVVVVRYGLKKIILYHHCFSLQYGVKEVQENEEGMKLNGAHGRLVYCSVDLLDEKIKIIKKCTEVLLDDNTEV
jgi:hypothetical protein